MKRDGRRPAPHPTIKDAMTVPLTRGKFAIIDRADAEAVAAWTWCAHAPHKSRAIFYAAANVNGKYTTLHRFLWRHWGMPSSHIDHINCDGLDNRRSNLRAATPSQNVFNTRIRVDNASGYKGVSRLCGRWSAMISIDGKNKWLGYFATPEDAAEAYRKKAIETRGQFARLR